ncbi:hypothetical protein [Ensifer sp. B1-9]|uniref:hypothetical protein n=1 Tax=Ensifer sp. B1-9 TaxID=3141455 RepID=UPI003D1A1A18
MIAVLRQNSVLEHIPEFVIVPTQKGNQPVIDGHWSTAIRNPVERKPDHPLAGAAMKLDWFLSRGLKIGESRIIPSLDQSGRPLSDHDLITSLVEGFE